METISFSGLINRFWVGGVSPGQLKVLIDREGAHCLDLAQLSPIYICFSNYLIVMFSVGRMRPV